MNPRAEAMLSYARELRDSIHAYHRLAKRYPKRRDHFRQQARTALWRACFWLDWVRFERNRERSQ